MRIYIYKLSDPRTGKCRYVGKTNKPAVRLKGHRSVRCNYSTSKWREELLVLGLYPQLDVIEEVDDARWHEREQYWIEHLRGQGNNLLNIATWPSPGPGFNHLVAQATRNKLRQAFKGRPIPPEQRAQISKTLTGKVQSPETVAKRKETINQQLAKQGKSAWQFGVSKNERKRRYNAGARKLSPSYLERKEGHPDKFSPKWKAKIAATLKARFVSLSPEEQERIRQYGRHAREMIMS